MEVLERMFDQGYNVKFTKQSKVFLAQAGYDQQFGARPIKRAIQNYVEDLLADNILNNTMKVGDKVYTINHIKGSDKLSLK